MPGVIIEPDQVREVAEEFRKASKSNQEVVKTLDDAMKNLHDHWQSASQQMFYRDYKEWHEYAVGSVALLANIAKELEAIADRFVLADK
jgi:WXG100 family type VII secretion target